MGFGVRHVSACARSRLGIHQARNANAPRLVPTAPPVSLPQAKQSSVVEDIVSYVDSVNACLLLTGSVTLAAPPGISPVGSVALSVARECTRPVMVVKVGQGGGACVPVMPETSQGITSAGVKDGARR